MACVVDLAEVALRARGLGTARSVGAACVVDLAEVARGVRGIARALLATFKPALPPSRWSPLPLSAFRKRVSRGFSPASFTATGPVQR